MINVTQIRRKTVPKNRSRMIERSVCNFNTRGERRATKGDKRTEKMTEYNDVKNK